MHRVWIALAGLALLAACGATTDAAEGAFEPKAVDRLVVATTLPAPGFWDGTAADGPVGGFEGSLAQELADEWDLRLSVEDLPFPDIASGALAGADIALAQVSITGEREEVVDFSIPYFTSYPTVLGRSGEELTDLATARERRWAVRLATTEEEYVEDVIRPDDDPLVVDDEASAVQAVLDGRADVALVDLPTALILALETPGLDVLSRFDREEQYGVVLPEGSANAEAVDKALRRLGADGTLDDLAERWLHPLYAVNPDQIPVIQAR